MLQRSIHPGATKTWSLRWGLELLETAPRQPNHLIVQKAYGSCGYTTYWSSFWNYTILDPGSCPNFLQQTMGLPGFHGEKQDSSKNLVAIRLYVAWTKQQNIEHRFTTNSSVLFYYIFAMDC